jgi:hypothetical protein
MQHHSSVLENRSLNNIISTPENITPALPAVYPLYTICRFLHALYKAITMFHVKYTLYRKCETYIPRNETAPPKRQRKGKTDTFSSGFLRTVEMMMQTFGQNAAQILTSVGHFFRQRFSLAY